MNRERLTKIISLTWPEPLSEKEMDCLYEPEYLTQPLNESYLDKCLCFDCKKHGLIFLRGELSCVGVWFYFKSSRFEKIMVTVNYSYDGWERKIYNYVLANPRYTDSDRFGKKSITQAANTVKGDADLVRYFNRLYKRFECPVLE